MDRAELRALRPCRELCERAEAARGRLALPGGRETLGFALLLLANRAGPDRV